jgi:hypothetical protein
VRAAASCAAVVVALVLAGACGGSGPVRVPPAHAPRITGWLTTSRERVVDAAGRPVRLLGVDEPGLIGGQGGDRLHPDACGEGWLLPAPSEYRAIAREGFNSVRLGLSWANLEPTPPRVRAAGGIVHRWNRPYLDALDHVVTGFTRAGIAVVLDMHQNHMSPAFTNPVPDRCEGSGLPTWVYPDPTVGADRAECDFFADRRQPGVPIGVQAGYGAAWTKVARRYASNRMVVGADLFNEPSSGVCRGLDVTPFYRSLGTRIRHANPHLLLICEAGTGPADTSPLRRSVGMPGWVYSFHAYLRPGESPDAVAGASLRRAAQWRAPAWVGELGVFQRGAPTAIPVETGSQLRATVDYLRRHHAGWAFHQYAGGAVALTRRSGGAVLHRDWLAALKSGF